MERLPFGKYELHWARTWNVGMTTNVRFRAKYEKESIAKMRHFRFGSLADITVSQNWSAFCLLADMDLGREPVPERMAVICVCWPWYRPNPTEALVRARIAIDQVRLSRLATQSAIERSRDSLAQTRSALAALRSFDSTAIRRKIQQRINAMDLRKAG